MKIEEGLNLNNPTMEINNISYPQRENKVIVECHFKEENSSFIHSRNYTFENLEGADLIYSDVVTLMRSNDILNALLKQNV
tara:strand:- start:6 stop:248 length:243 start_codon:yes stop_codon:yes gene_type:complete